MRSKQNRYPTEFKQQIIKEVIETGNATLVARKHDLVADTVTRWMRESKQSNNHTASSKYSNNKDSNSISKRNDQLKKLLEKKDLEIGIRYRYLQPFILNYQLH